MKHTSFNAFVSIIQRDLILAFRSKADWLNPLCFFVIIVTLFPLAVSPDSKIIAILGPGVIWVAALLSTLLSLDGVFRVDHDDGTLQHLLLSPLPLPILVIAKIVGHWMITGLPLIILSPLLGMFMNLNGHAIVILMVSLLLGTPILSFIGAIAVALIVGLRNGGVLLSLLVLPLYIPVLIFGASAVTAATQGIAVSGQLAFEGALLVLAVTFAPLAVAAALKIGMHE